MMPKSGWTGASVRKTCDSLNCTGWGRDGTVDGTGWLTTPTLQKMEAKNDPLIAFNAGGLAGDDTDPTAVHGGAQNLPTSLGDGLFDAVAGFRLYQQNHATAASRPANLTCKSAITTGVFNYAVDGLGGNRGEVAFA